MACTQGDFPAQRMIDAVPGVDPARKERLIKVWGQQGLPGLRPCGRMFMQRHLR